MDPLRRVLELTPPAADTLRVWWEATAAIRGEGATTIDRALIGGACADRIGFAFASGYSEALRALVPGLEGISALCATESDGNHPRAIKTALVEVVPAPVAGAPSTETPARSYTLTGHKKWATVASEAAQLLVVASIGEVDGKNRLRVVRVRVDQPGVTIRASTAPFIPEIPHAEVELAGVVVTDADILPGDGYDDYLKPFRTVEDIHVHGALLGYLIGVARRYAMPNDEIENLLALAQITRSLAAADRGAASTHLALAGLIRLATAAVAEIEQHWRELAAPAEPAPNGSSPGAAATSEPVRWQRDRALLQVAGAARKARRERAWSELS